MTNEEVIKAVEGIEGILGGYTIGVPNPKAGEEIEKLINIIRHRCNDEGFVTGKLESIKRLAEALFGASIYKRYTGGTEEAKLFILSDCANIKHYVSKQRETASKVWKVFIFFIIVFFLEVNDSKANIIDYCTGPSENGGYIDIEPYRPTYFIYTFGTPDETFNNNQNLKFQFSVKQLLCRNLYLAYTQKSVWNYFDESSPFRESNYNPEVFLDLKNQERIKLPAEFMNVGLIGIEHESNGLGGADSRSWNKVYWEPYLFYNKRDLTNKSSDLFTVSIRGWTTFEVGGENKDIKDYFGDGNVIFQYRFSHFTSEEKKEKNIDKRIQAILKMRKGRRHGVATQIDISIKYLLPITFRLHLWDGYGETLVDYNVRATRYGIGVTIANGTFF